MIRLAARIGARPARLISAATLAAASLLLLAERAEAAPSCPDMEVATPFETPVTITLQCQDPEYPITGYTVLGQSGPINLPGNTTTYTPPPGFSGRVHALTYAGSNSVGMADIGIVQVTVGAKPGLPPPPPPPANRPPVARCDSYSVKPGEHFTVKAPGVLLNDSDPDGDRLLVNQYASNGASFRPYIPYTGSVRFTAPTSPRMLSYRYVVTDGMLEAESTVTLWVGMEDKGCRAAFDPPPESKMRTTVTLLKTGGTVRIRAGGRWHALGRRLNLTRPLTVDARQGSVQLRLVRATNYTRTVTSGRFAGGLFKLGKVMKLAKGKRLIMFHTIGLAGGLSCAGGAGPGRRLAVSATYGLFFEALRMQVFPMAIRNRTPSARFTLWDRCNGTSVVRTRKGRIGVRDHASRGTHVLTGRRTYVARGRR